MKRVLLIQPGFQGPGGGDGVAAWMVQALWPHFETTVATWEKVIPSRVDRYFGTSLEGARVRWLVIPRLRKAWVDAIPFRHGLLRASILLRWAKRLEESYDLKICALCEAALGQAGIQYVHIPWTVHPWTDVDPIWYTTSLSWLRRLYEEGCAILAGRQEAQLESNRTLVNSDWTGRLWSSRYESTPYTLYPPVISEQREPSPWSERRDHFLCLGRLAEDKRIEMVVAILERLRLEFPQLLLHVVGAPDSPGYAARLSKLAVERPWLKLHHNLSRPELHQLMAQCRYGIHGKAQEHFGMGIAEMVKAGCLTFVPADGGQVEIVGGCQALLYHTPEQAVTRISAVLRDKRLRDQLKATLQAAATRFGAEQFQEQFLAHVTTHFEARGVGKIL